ncbi:hypothetical protein [Gimesia sp.]|uniref:hypothetical protein n=1 Tax=Gimesia sp. TaxID=2024833 RepID=UPI0032EEAF9D
MLSSTLSARGATNKAQAEEAFAGTRAAINFAPEGIKLVGGQTDAQRKYNETVAKVKSVTRTSRMQR